MLEKSAGSPSTGWAAGRGTGKDVHILRTMQAVCASRIAFVCLGAIPRKGLVSEDSALQSYVEV